MKSKKKELVSYNKSVMHDVVIISTNDLGRSFRLLFHAKNIASIPESHVYLIGPDFHSIPKEIENSPNITHKYLFPFRLRPDYFNLLFFPFRLFIILFQVMLLCFSLPSIDFVICSSECLLLDILCANVIRFFKKSKLILDVSPFKNMNSKSIIKSIKQRIDNSKPKNADICIAPTRSLQIILDLQKVKSYIVRDFPGHQFTPHPELKEEICMIFNVTIDYLLIALPLIDSHNHEHLKIITNITKYLDSNGIKSILVIFCQDHENTIMNQMKKNSFKNSNINQNENRKVPNVKYVPINSTEYPKILSSCDFGIILDGSSYGLDLTSTLLQMMACGVPPIVSLKGCVREIIFEGKTGFLFSNQDELFTILSKIIIKKEVDLSHISKKLTSESLFEDSIPWKDILNFE
ncbi:hypothetical protein TRFO_14479 [Tritrichomonas foetus]|uniref:Glycosyl transferase family 1 domain-containing protein n=1 Tax=Tritrichomonas foetus TaxID=1144522 RepID=A0A1J4KZU5_9EUKA|nr:hypothetical protein TRFO_14479 [Tritrichomonas foetus]|eukprot:OHT15117.1 hypothetical protein TRFO_14479 [Tritrichomonas foetus]